METNTLFASQYLEEAKSIIGQLDHAAIEKMTRLLVNLRERGGRLFLVGVGGGAGHAGHAVNDFRKLAGIESYSPSDNISELTARTNDEGWDTALVETLKIFRPTEKDILFVLSVGGGSQTTSLNLVRVMEFAKLKGMKICSIVSRNGGEAKKMSDISVLVPVLADERITPHAEGFQAVIWHCIVNGVCK